MKAKLIIMDEPTSSLSKTEVEHLLRTIQELKRQGIAILYISHKLEELKRIGDRISILRDGRIIGTYPLEEITTDRMIQLMVGRQLNEKYPKTKVPLGKEGFRIEQFQLKGSVHKVSFTAYQGQIVGIAGLVGAGRTELARGIFGIDPIESGNIYVFGQKRTIQSPRDALHAGLALIPENRKEEGLILDQSVEFNMSLATLHHRFRINNDELRRRSERYIDELQIHPKEPTKHVGYLSGGNQQKVVISKWLATEAKVYLFDEPTRGIDVGAKVEVYHLLNLLVERGAIVLIISSELPEILGMCDRVLVMKDGEVTADLLTKETDQEEIMRAATGGIM
jgi:ribose transport system ATP-binding protein